MCSKKGVLMDIYSLSKMNLKLLKYFVLCYFFEIFGDAKLYSVRVYNNNDTCIDYCFPIGLSFK